MLKDKDEISVQCSLVSVTCDNRPELRLWHGHLPLSLMKEEGLRGEAMKSCRGGSLKQLGLLLKIPLLSR